MDKDTTPTNFNFRPRVSELGHWNCLRKLCQDRGIDMCAIFNAMLLPMASEIARQPKNPDKTYVLDLGAVTIE